MKTITEGPAGKRDYIVFKAFQRESQWLLLGSDPFGNPLYAGLYQVDQDEFLEFDQALEPWREKGLVSKSYKFRCGNCGYGNGGFNRDFNPPGESQMCQEGYTGCPPTEYDEIPGIVWDVVNLRSNPEIKESELNLELEFRRMKNDRPFDLDFVRQYIGFVGARLHGIVQETESGLVYPVFIKPEDTPKMLETWGLIEAITFRGKE